VPPRRLQPACPRDLETICLKCLEKDPARRYASASDLGDDLQRFLEGRPIRARPVGSAEALWRWCRRNPKVAGLTLALVLGGTLSLAVMARLWWQARDNFRQAQENLAEVARQRDLADQLAYRVDRDGKSLLMGLDQQGPRQGERHGQADGEGDPTRRAARPASPWA
jgi:hypothetical protein